MRMRADIGIDIDADADADADVDREIDKWGALIRVTGTCADAKT